MKLMLGIDRLDFAIAGTSILNGVTFDIEAGSTVGLIGPNGSGKTTLFNCISGFYYPQAGTLIYNGQDITHLPAYRRAQLGLGRVFQNPGIFREMSLLENMITALEGRQGALKNLFVFSKNSRLNRERAMQYLSQVDLKDKAHVKASSLSGGQMRLLEIVRTLAFGAELFLLDEPTAGVSPKMKEDVARLVRQLQNLGKTILVIEHDINFIQKFCRRIIVMDEGKVVLDGSPQEVRSNPLLQEIYFGSNEE